MFYYYLTSLFGIMFIIMAIILYNFMLMESVVVLELILYHIQLFEMKLYFYSDYISMIFLMVVSLISMTTLYYSKMYMEQDKNQNKFLLLTFMFIMSMFIMIMSMNMWTILIGWDGLGVTSFLLVIYYNSNNSNYSGIITIMTNRLGDIGMILSIYLLFHIGTMDIVISNASMELFNLFFILMIFGIFTKSAQFPFMSWLPLAMAAPTPISALVHSSTLVTSGVYLMIRYHFLNLNQNNFNYNLILLVLLTLMISNLSALSELDIKKIIAFSTLSQLALMMIITIMGQELMSFFHMMTHALFKAVLFLCSGIFIHNFCNNQDIRNYPMSLKINIFTVSMFMVCSLSLMGFPYLSGFYSKDLILEMIYMMNYNILILLIMIFSTLLTSLYSLRLIYYSFLLGKKGFTWIYLNKWDLMQNSLMFCFLGVLMFGSLLNWLFLEKLNIIYLNIKMKLINLILISMGFLMYKYMNICIMSKYYMFFMSMFYMTPMQGMMINYINNNNKYYSHFSEMMLENFMQMKLNTSLNKMHSILNLIKFSNFYMIFFIIYLMWYFIK